MGGKINSANDAVWCKGSTQDFDSCSPSSNLGTVANQSITQRCSIKYLGVAQFGRASDLGSEGRKFESCHLDQLNMRV